MTSSFHKYVLNAMTAPNPPQIRKFDKYNVKTKEIEIGPTRGSLVHRCSLYCYHLMASSAARTLPTTTTQRLRVEACRASVLALHAAAGLASGPDADRQLLRVLRSAEALARTAVALASSLPKTAAPAPADVAAPCAGGSRRRRHRSKKKKVTEDVAMVESAHQQGEVCRSLHRGRWIQERLLSSRPLGVC